MGVGREEKRQKGSFTERCRRAYDAGGELGAKADQAWERGIGEEVMSIRLWSINALNIRSWHNCCLYRA